jgi:hypothetical protein
MVKAIFDSTLPRTGEIVVHWPPLLNSSRRDALFPPAIPRFGLVAPGTDGTRTGRAVAHPLQEPRNHANGDGAIDMTLRVYERLQRELPRRDPRFRLGRCTVINDSLV